MSHRYAVIGIGAIGAYIAACLTKAGIETHCLARSNYQHIKQYGLKIIDAAGDFSTPLEVYDRVDLMPKADVIVITTKSTANDILPTVLPALMHDNSLVLVLQNGIGVEQEIAQDTNPAQILGGSCMLKCFWHSIGVLEHSALNNIDIAQYYADDKVFGISEHVKAVVADINQTRINAIAQQHLPTVRWQKLVSNIPGHALSILHNNYYQSLINDKRVLSLLKSRPWKSSRRRKQVVLI